MTSNILVAIKNLIENPITALTAHYSGRNRVNGIGNALEVYIKDLFANTLLFPDEYSRLMYIKKFFHIQEIKIILLISYLKTGTLLK